MYNGVRHDCWLYRLPRHRLKPLLNRWCNNFEGLVLCQGIALPFAGNGLQGYRWRACEQLCSKRVSLQEPVRAQTLLFVTNNFKFGTTVELTAFVGSVWGNGLIKAIALIGQSISFYAFGDQIIDNGFGSCL